MIVRDATQQMIPPGIPCRWREPALQRRDEEKLSRFLISKIYNANSIDWVQKEPWIAIVWPWLLIFAPCFATLCGVDSFYESKIHEICRSRAV